MTIGVMVTLRGERMYELSTGGSVALPRVRDFRGVSPKAFDAWQLHDCIREQLIFPESTLTSRQDARNEYFDCHHGAQDEQARALLKGLGMPFRQYRFRSQVGSDLDQR